MKRLLVAGLASLALGSCESTTAPGAGNGFPVGDTVTLSLVPHDSTHVYSLTIGAHESYLLYVKVLQGGATFLFTDSGGRIAPFGPSAAYSQFRSQLPLLSSALIGLDSTLHGTFKVQVLPFPEDSAAQVRFVLARINQDPETRGSHFTIGDTVSDAISPPADVDVFTTNAQAGQRLFAVLEQTGAGSPGVQLVVADSAGTVRGFAATSATGVPSSTGPIASGPLPLSGPYSFRVSAANFGNLSQFQGGYRFWTYIVNPAPEHHAAAIVPGSVISGESIDQAGDIDEFRFTATSGQMMEGYIQSAHPVQLDIIPAGGGSPIASAQSVTTDTALFDQPTGRFQILTGGSFIARVSPTSPGVLSDTGAYRIYLFPVNTAPEHAPASIVLGDTVSESIDAGGDVDDFTFNVNAGDTYSVFLQSLSAATHVELDAIDGSGPSVLRSVTSTADTGLYVKTTGIFRVNVSGMQRLRFYGTDDRTTGPYRFVVYRMSSKPETSPDSIIPGDSVLTESLSPPGDVDEFRFSVPIGDTSAVNLVLSVPGAPPNVALVAEIENTGTLQIVGTTGPGTGGQTGFLRLGHGIYVARVYGFNQNVARVPYHIWLFHSP